MKKFIVKACGTSSDKLFWNLITETIDGFECRAFIRTTKAVKKGDEITVPEHLAKTIKWTL